MATFKYGNEELDSNKLAKYLHDNAKGWAESSQWKDKNAVLTGINEMIGRIESGDIDSLSYSGEMHSNSDFTNNAQQKHLFNYTNKEGNRKGIIRTGKTLDTHGIAASFLNDALTAYSKNVEDTKQKEQSTPKEKFDARALIDKNWLNNNFGGYRPSDSDFAIYRKGKSNWDIYGDILKSIEGVANGDYSNYDFSNSNYSGIDDYKSKVGALRQAYDNQDEDAFKRALLGVGYDTAGLDYIFGTAPTNSSNNQKTKLQQDLAAYRKTLEDNGGYSQSMIDEMVAEEEKRLRQEAKNRYSEATYNRDFTNYLNGIQSKTGGITYNEIPLGFDDLDAGGTDSIYSQYIGDKENSTNESGGRFFDAKGNKTKLYTDIENAVLHGRVTGLNKNAIRSYVKSIIETEPSASTELDGKKGSYILNKSVDYDNGTAVVYDTKAKTIKRIRISNSTPTLKRLFENRFKSNRKLKNGGIIKAQQGIKALRDLRYQQRMQKEAQQSGKSVDQVKLGHENAYTSDNKLSQLGYEGMSNSDYIRTVAGIADVGAAIASFVPGFASAAGLAGLGTTAATAYADFTDDSVSAGEAWKNLGINVGLSAASMFGGAIAKGSKALATVVKGLPTLLAGYGLVDTLNDKDFQKAFGKLQKYGVHFDKYETNDIKALANAFKAVSMAIMSGKTFAGHIGSNYGGNKNIFGKAANVAGHIGNNTYGGLARKNYARYKEVQRLGGEAAAERIPLGGNANEWMIGGQKVNKATAIAMQKAARGAAKKGSTGDQIKQAAIDAYKNSDEGKAQITPATKADRFADLKALREGIRQKSTDNKYTLNGQTVTPEQRAELLKAYSSNEGLTMPTKPGAGATAEQFATYREQMKQIHEGRLKALNAKFGEMFDKPAVDNTPKFDFGDIGSTNKWYQYPFRLYEGRLGAQSTAPWWGARVKDVVMPNRTGRFDHTTASGRHNIKILNAASRGNTSQLPTDIAYNMGMWGGTNRVKDSERIKNAKANAKAEARQAKEENSKIARVASKTARRIAANSKDEYDRLGRVARIGELRDKVKQKQESALMSKIARKVATNSKEEYDRQSRVDRIGELRKSVVRSRAKRIAFKSKLNENKNKAMNLMVNGKQKLNDLKGKFSKNSKTSTTNSTPTEAPSILPASGTPTKLGSYKGIGGKKTLNSSALKSLRNTNAKKVADVNNDEALSMEWSKKMGIPESIMKKGKSVTRLYNEIYQDDSGKFYYWKQGGKVPFFQQGTKFPTINWGQYQQPTDWGYQPPQPTNPQVYSNYFVDKDNNGNDIPIPAQVLPNWFAGRWKYNQLNNWNSQLDSSKAQQSIAENKWHKFGNDLTAPYLSNKSYTDNSKIVGEDLNNYYNSAYKGKSLADYVQGYNSNIDNLTRFFDNDLSYSTADSDDVKAHNQLFKAMYASRSGNTNNDWDLGYSVPNEGQLGSTTWARRGDQYETEFDQLTDEQKKSRIHKIGDLGYVYKMANGKIGVVDDGTVSKLGLKGATTDPVTANKPSKFKSFLSGLGQGIDPGLAQIPLGLAANKRMLDLALNKRVSLNGYTPVHRQVLGDYSTLQNGLSTANSTEALGDRMASNISNSNNAIAARLQANSNANQQRAQANAIFDQGTAKSKEAAWTQEKENSAKLDEVANENRMRLTQKFNTDQDVRIAADPYNNIIKPFIMEQSYDYKTNKQNRKQAAVNMAKLNIDNYVETKLGPLKNKYTASGAQSDYVKYQSALTELKNDPQYKQLMAEYYRANGYDPNKINSVNSNAGHQFVQTGSLAQQKNGGKLTALKKGNKISDDGPVKTRSKDADRFQKTMKSFTDSHDKKVARLANSALLSLKRTMGK